MMVSLFDVMNRYCSDSAVSTSLIPELTFQSAGNAEATDQWKS